MPNEPPSRIRRWTLATIILALLTAATLFVGGAAAQSETCERGEDSATGYNCLVSGEFNSLDVAEGTELALGTDDVSEPIDVGFEFAWFDTTQTQVNVSTKGLLCFTDTDCADYIAQPTPDAEAPNDLVACFWEDLDAARGTVRYNRTSTAGGQQAFVVEYTDVPHWGTDQFNTFQIQLLADGTVRCELEDVTHDDGHDELATAVGIENAAGDHGVRYKFDSFSATNTEVLFGQTPDAPADLQATAGPGLAEISLDWSPVEGEVDAYKIYRRPSEGASATLVETVPAGQTSHEDDEGLDDDEDYFYSVSATNAFGEGPNSSLTDATTFGPPTPPQNPNAAPGSAHGEIDLDWDAPAQPNATQWYHVHRNTTSGDFEQVKNTTATEWTDHGVTIGHEYTYKVTAIAKDRVGESEYSDLATSYPAGPTAPPTPPQNLQATPGTNEGELDLDWDAPAQPNGTRWYHVYRNTTSGDFEEVKNTTATEWTDRDLSSGTEYTYNVTAVAYASVGESEPSENAVSVPAGPPAPPASADARDNPQENPDDPDPALNVSWTAPETTGGSPVTSYRLERSLDNGTFGFRASVDADARWFNDTAVDCENFYQYRIYAVNEHGESAPAEAGDFSRIGCPDPPQNTAVTEDASQGTLIVDWDAPSDTGGSPVDHYHLSRSTDGGLFSSLGTVVHPDTSFTDEDVGCDTSYEYRLTTNNTEGETSANAYTSFSTDGFCPSEVWGASASPDDTASAIVVSWNAVNDTGAPSSLEHYQIDRAVGTGDFQALEKEQPSDDLRIEDSEVTCGAIHTYRITPANTYGSGTADEASVTLENACPSEPQNPTTEAGTNAADTPAPDEVNVSWSAPADEGWSSVDQYVISRCNNDANNCADPTNSGWSEVGTAQTTAPLYHVDTGLDAGTEYAYRVVAENAQGEGDSSATVTATTPEAPNAPEDVTVSNVTDRPLPTSSVTVEWSAPSDTGGVDLLEYHVYRRSVEENDDQFTQVASVDAGTTSYEDTPPGPGDYCYAVSADNTFEGPMGGGEDTEDRVMVDPTAVDPEDPTEDCAAFASAVAPPTVSCDGTLGEAPVLCPNPPENPSATADDRTITVDWERPDSTAPGLGETGTNATILAYRVHRAVKADGACGGFSHHATVSAELPGETEAPIQYPDTELDAATTYCYNVTAIRGNEDTNEALPLESNASDIVEATTDGLPSEPTNLAASSSTDGQATLTWDAPAQTNGSDLQRYRVYRDAGCTGSFTQIDAVTGTTYIDRNNSAGDDAGMPAGDYCYKVSAENGVGEGPAADGQATVANSAPGAPTGPDAVDSADGEVTVNWTAPTQTGGSEIHHYEIDRRASDGTWEEGYETVPGGTLQLVDDELVQGVTFCYEISAFNTAHDDQGNDVAGQESVETSKVCATA